MASTEKSKAAKPIQAAACHGVKVPDSPFLTPGRIERINSERYEGKEVRGALAVVQPGDKVLEMGAGIGLVGAIIAKNAKPAKVLSFEANPNLMAPIDDLHKMNRLGSKITVRNEVLISAPDAPKSMPFHLHKSYLGSSLLDPAPGATTQVDVPTASYAKVHAEYAPDVLIIDIEGGELDFLRHASLDGVRAIVIEFHPKVYGRECMRECKSIIEEAGFAKMPEHCTQQVWTCVHAPHSAPPSAKGGWSAEMQTLENAVIVPAEGANLVEAAGVLDADGNHCTQGALWRNGRALTVAPDMPKGDIETRKGTWLWGGVLWMHFGHFLVESTARLWALDHLKQDIDGVLFVPKRPRNGEEVKAFQHEMMKLLGSDVPLISVATPERVERLIVPGQGFGLGGMVAGTHEYRSMMAQRFGQNVTPDGPEKLYISRSALPSGRGNLIGEPELEAYLRDEGYTIYHPEKHNLTHQVATYKAARKVIAAEGSALHLLAMVAKADQDIAMIVRRPSGATRNIETHITSFTGKAPLSLSHLVQSWKPKGAAKPRMWKGELDMPAVQSALSDAGFLRVGAKPWTSLDPQDVIARLGDGFEKAA